MIGHGSQAEHQDKFRRAQEEAYLKYQPGFHQIMEGYRSPNAISHGRRSNSRAASNGE